MQHDLPTGLTLIQRIHVVTCGVGDDAPADHSVTFPPEPYLL